MILNGKAKEEFEKWIWIYANQKEKQNIGIETFLEWFYDADEVIRNAYYILWFDSVGIKILPCYGLSGWYCEVKDFNNKEFGNYKRYIVGKTLINDFDTRAEATTKAIEKAVETFNNLHNGK